jgi:hypothetical protein
MKPYRPTQFSMPRGANLEKLREIDRKRQAYYASLKGQPVVADPKQTFLVEADTFVAPPTRSTAETPAERAAVEIPATWRDLPWPKLRSLASKVCDEPISNRNVALAAIEAELQRRQ